MPNKTILLSTLTFLISLFFSQFTLVFAQSTEEGQIRIKDFGSSLKNNSKKKNEKSEPIKNTDEDIVRIETTLIVTDVLVTDKKGNYIKGLKKEDFTVTEDGKPQQLETFSMGDDGNVPRSIVLVIDYSGSLTPYIKTSIEAAEVLVDKLKPKDKMAIVTDDVELLVDFTTDKNLLKDKLALFKDKASDMKIGQSEQFSALYAVLNEIFNKEDVRPIIIFQTDGDELSALKGGGLFKGKNNSSSEFKEREFSFDDILISTDKARATIYTIYPGFCLIGFPEREKLERTRKEFEVRFNAGQTEKTQEKMPKLDDISLKDVSEITLKWQSALVALAKHTGGWADYLETPEQANEIYSRILSSINNSYLLSYYPTNEGKDGKRRVVKIGVRNHPEYIVGGRKSYILSESKN